MKKILLDTDIGSDIDDAVALGYLLAHPDADIVGITTVRGQAHVRASLVSLFLKIAGKSIPIAPGASMPLTPPYEQTYWPKGLRPLKWANDKPRQASLLESWEHDVFAREDGAVAFMSEMIRKHPGEIELVAIGPLTNIAKLFQAEPDIPGLLKGLYIMGGHFVKDFAPKRLHWEFTEWNMRCDPVAADIVYRSDVAVNRSFGFDVTACTDLDRETAESRFTSPVLAPLTNDFEHWFSIREHMTFHDSVVAVALFELEICEYAQGLVEIETGSRYLQGFTYFDPDRENKPHEVAVGIDKNEFFERYFSVFQ